jgi:hypothetical protein
MRTEPWDKAALTRTPSRRDGRDLSQDASRIVINPVLLQERDELSLKIAFFMMLLLAATIQQ